MLTSIYVVDYILHDLESAKPVYDRIFATEPLWINPDMAPGAEVDAMYYQMPGPVGHVTTLGFFGETKDVRVEREGAKLLGIQCRDLEATTAEMRRRGVRFTTDEPQTYAVGRNITTVAYGGVSFSISEHEPGGHEKARKMMFTRAGDHDYGDASQSGVLDRVHIIHWAVEDLDGAVNDIAAVLGAEPITRSHSAKEGLDIAYFAAPGDGFGVQYLVLVSPATSISAESEGQRVRSFLEQHGEGIYLIGFLVSDLARMQASLHSRGVQTSDAHMSVAAVLGDGFALPPLHNVTLWFASQTEGEAERLLDSVRNR